MQRLNENIMQNVEQNTPLANNHISVDCVVIGFDGEQLKVLLVKRAGEEEGEVFHDMKLPGSLIYMDEDLDEAAQRALELTRNGYAASAAAKAAAQGTPYSKSEVYKQLLALQAD